MSDINSDLALSFIQRTFSGMNRKVDTSLIGKDEYPLLVNGRIRDGVIEPTQRATAVSSAVLPAGLIQGVYAAANYLVVFVAGKAYAKDFNYPSSDFVQVAGFELDPSVDVIYAALVPESSINYGRLSADGSPSGTITYKTSPTAPSPQAMVCQDGKSQPVLIKSDATSRVTGSYESWTTNNREYVPIGKQMLYYNGNLYIVSPDGNRIFRSVTKAPLDFVVAIDTAGNKLPNPADGDANSLSIRVNYEQVTALREISSESGAFLVCTERSSTLVALDPNAAEVFGEPQYRYQYLFSTGAKNQFSVVDILGDTAIIDFGGIKTFNSILQTRIEGKNSAFSAIVNKLFKGVLQSVCAATFFDNYALFAVDSVYGHVVVVYDTINKSFVSVDKFSNVSGSIKQFAEVITTSTRKLFFITTDNQLYEAYSGTRENCGAYIGDFCSQDPRSQLKPREVNLVFVGVNESGTVSVTPFCDGKSSESLHDEIVATQNNSILPLDFPFGKDTQTDVFPPYFRFEKLPQCWKFGVYVEWAFAASLSFVGIDCGEVKNSNTFAQAAQNYQQGLSQQPKIESFAPTSGPVTAVLTATGSKFLAVTGVYLGDYQVTNYIVVSDSMITLVVPFEIPTGSYLLKFKTPTGFVYSSTYFDVSNS